MKITNYINIALIISLFSNPLFSQSVNLHKYNRIGIGLNYANSRLSEVKNGRLTLKEMEPISSMYLLQNQPIYQNTFGLNLSYQFAGQLSVISGVNFSKRHFRAYYVGFEYETPNEYEIKYTEIPIALEYKFTKNKVNPIIHLGLINNFKRKGQYEKDYFLNARFGVGAEAKLADFLSISTIFIYNRALTSMYAEYFSNESVGGEFSVIFYPFRF
ncbi:MAG: hypothetical protein ACI8TA_003083 [Cyclobacteriaceae bacterium]|jgi:hypothetical protein